MSVSLFVCLLPYQNQTKGYLQFWKRYLSGIFSRHSLDIGTQVKNNTFLGGPRFFEDIHDMLVHWFQIILIFLYVCHSGSWYSSLMKPDKFRKFRDISSSGWDIFLNIYWHITGMLVHLFQLILDFFNVCQSVSWLTFLLKLDQ